MLLEGHVAGSFEMIILFAGDIELLKAKHDELVKIVEACF